MSSEMRIERLSFRVTKEIIELIDLLIQDHPNVFATKKRSEFGQKAVEHYIHYLNSKIATDSHFYYCRVGTHLVTLPIPRGKGFLCPEHVINGLLKSYDGIQMFNFIFSILDKEPKI